MQFTGMELSTLATLAGGTAAAVTLLYLMKLRKRRIEVPFSPLWRTILVEHRRQSDWWRRFRRLMSWLLHILMVALLAFALADPHAEDEVLQGRNILLLIDSSASMAATDVSGGANRLDVAKKKALEILRAVGPEDRVMLVNFDNQVEPLSPFVSEASILEQPLRDIEVSASATAFENALAFAADSVRDVPSGELVIVSDGAGIDAKLLDGLDFGPNTTVRHLKVGESSGNLAITAFNVRRYVSNKLDFELFVSVKSYFDRAVTAQIEIYADERLVDQKPITLESGAVHQQFYPSQAVSGERLEARVRLTSSDARDVFPLDDRAFALLPPETTTDVLVVTEGNLYLEGPLFLNPNLNVTRVTPAEYDPQKHASPVVIFDRVAPKTPAKGNFFFIAPQGDDSPWQSKGEAPDPIITRVRKSHRLMRWITLKDVNIGSALRLETTRDDDVVASSALGVPILVTRQEDEGRRMVALSFDVRNSDLPLRVAFPVFLINMVDWFTTDDDSLVESYGTGLTWSVPVAKEATQATVTRPDGTKLPVPLYEGRAIVYGDQIGFYELETDAGTRVISGNLANPEESAIAPADIARADGGVIRDTRALVFDRSELWIWAALLVLLLLFAEWTTYNRRVTV